MKQLHPLVLHGQTILWFQLEEVYEKDINNIDVYVGGMLETTLDGNPGPLFSTIIKEQFERLRQSDRFWFESKDSG